MSATVSKEEVWRVQAQRQLLWYAAHSVTVRREYQGVDVSLCYICSECIRRSMCYTWDILPLEEENTNEPICYVVCCKDCTYCLSDDEKYRDVQEAVRMFEQDVEYSGALASMAMNRTFP
jgi:TPP-dependent indolepyruvate ferredoxin oxidoreductase alpha subunit